MKNIFRVLLFALLFPSMCLSRELSILFIGNSYTYLPGQGTSENPALPRIISQIASSIEPSLQIKYDFNTPPGYTIEKHFKDPKSTQLFSIAYDIVILQGQSIEALELPVWWKDNQGNRGVQSFSEFLPKVLNSISQKNKEITLFVNWGWNPKNSFLKTDHEGLHFPKGHHREGEKWCGTNKYNYQAAIDRSYEFHSRGFPVVLSYIGRSWLDLQDQGFLNEDDFYLAGDWSHPSEIGAFITALVLTRDSLKLDIAKNSYFPTSMDQKIGRSIQNYLASKNKSLN